MPKLLESEEFLNLAERANGNELAQAILQEIKVRGFVRQEPRKTIDELRKKAYSDWQFDAFEIKKDLPLYVYQKGSFIWYRYQYPYVKGKRIEGSTKIRVKMIFPMPPRAMKVQNLEKFKHLLWMKTDAEFSLLPEIKLPSDYFFLAHLKTNSWPLGTTRKPDHDEWGPGFEVFHYAENPKALFERLIAISGEHSMRLYHDTIAAISEQKDRKLIEQMKARLLRYSPFLYWALINEQRIKSGKPKIESLLALLEIERVERNKFRQSPEYKLARKQNANTKSKKSLTRT